MDLDGVTIRRAMAAPYILSACWGADQGQLGKRLPVGPGNWVGQAVFGVQGHCRASRIAIEQAESPSDKQNRRGYAASPSKGGVPVEQAASLSKGKILVEQVESLSER